MTRIRRSFMMTPLLDDHKVRKAAGCAVDIVVLDLEDGIHSDRKAEARTRVVDLLRSVDWRGKGVVVRVNAMKSPAAREDILAVAPARPAAIWLPKVDGADEIEAAQKIIDECPGAEPVKLWGLIESARGLVNVEQIAAVPGRLEALVLGPGDLGADLGLNVRRYTMAGDKGFREEILYAQSRIVAACRAFGISPMTGTPTILRDPEGAEYEARYLLRLGFETICAFTPAMVDAVHRAFMPEPEDVQWAESVLAVQQEKDAESSTVGVVDGAMVDGPFFRGAKQIVARAEAARAARAGRPSAPTPAS
jgi:citrate lyase subunit beta/citryl-CoA lyase